MVDGYLIQKEDAKEIVKAVNTVRNTPFNQFDKGFPEGDISWRRDHSVIQVYNNTGEDLEVFNIVKIGNRVLSSAFKNLSGYSTLEEGAFAFYTEKPSAPFIDNYAVLQSEAIIDGIGMAIVQGVTKVNLDDTDQGEYANPVDGDFTKMKTASSGLFPVICVNEEGEVATWGYVILGSKSKETFDAIINSSSGSNNQWTYAFSEVEKTTAGYSGWTVKSGGITGTAYNRAEDINSATGVQGNGVDADNLDTDDYTFALQACPDNSIVTIDVIELTTGVNEYWFTHENGVDGECD